MRFSGIILICVVIFLQEASCVSFQRALYNAMIKSRAAPKDPNVKSTNKKCASRTSWMKWLEKIGLVNLLHWLS